MPPARIVFWAATALGIALAVRSVLTEPPSLGISIACAALYFALLLSGILVLRLRMFADAVVRGPAGASGVALTFDDGPDALTTRDVLDVLDAHSAKATFFVIGERAEAQRDLLEEIVRRGHDIGIHGFVRDPLFVLRGGKRVSADLERAIRIVENITDKSPLLFRPPRGHTNPTIARIVDRLEMTTVGWSANAGDARSFADGAIVRLRDAAGARVALESIAAKNLRVTLLAPWLA